MLDRRKLLLGGAAFALSGCKILDGANDYDSRLRAIFASAETLTRVSQRGLNRGALAPEFTPADIRQGQHPNGSTDPDSAEYLDLAAAGFANYRLRITGLVDNPLDLTYAQIKAMPARSHITRHDCVVGWSCIDKWTDVPLASVLNAARPTNPGYYHSNIPSAAPAGTTHLPGSTTGGQGYMQPAPGQSIIYPPP